MMVLRFSAPTHFGIRGLGTARRIGLSNGSYLRGSPALYSARQEGKRVNEWREREEQEEKNNNLGVGGGAMMSTYNEDDWLILPRS